MGWASGSSVFDGVWAAVRDHIAESSRVSVCMKVLEAFEDEDCDTLSECFDSDKPEIEEAYYTLNPDYRDEP